MTLLTNYDVSKVRIMLELSIYLIVGDILRYTLQQLIKRASFLWKLFHSILLLNTEKGKSEGEIFHRPRQGK